jgi:predicted transcriptional regulator
LYNDIFKTIIDEITTKEDSVAKTTRVQLRCNLAYDKLARYLVELESKKMILQSPLLIGEGRIHLEDYDRISNFVVDIAPDETRGV